MQRKADVYDGHGANDLTNDRDLVLRVKGGQESAFKELFVKYGKKLYYFSRKKNLSHEDAEGVVQDVFAKIWEIKEGLDETLSINSYIITIAKNLIYNRSRKQLNQRLFEEYLVYSQRSKSHHETEDQVFFKELEGIVFEIIKKLSPRAQLIFKMNRLDGMTNSEIAEELHISKKTVENQMHTALKYLRETLVKRADINLVSLLAILVKYC
ncbi:MAG: RNA polymerase sigma-70 factor [Reichenbachiella sp.]|uniref:RNA polymerase sigma-70 factor n=1 Tax=Reichenbachiella sp. TaxID=2184521 RepID=UPI003267633C